MNNPALIILLEYESSSMFQLMRACKSSDTCIGETVTIAKSEREQRISLQSENDFAIMTFVGATQDSSHN